MRSSAARSASTSSLGGDVDPNVRLGRGRQLAIAGEQFAQVERLRL